MQPFVKHFELMFPVVKIMIDEACEEAKPKTKAKYHSGLGSWERSHYSRWLLAYQGFP